MSKLKITALAACFMCLTTAMGGQQVFDMAKATARKTASGIIITGDGECVRAFEPFLGRLDNGKAYAEAISRYASELGGNVRVYSMVIPTAAAYYCPDTAKAWTNDELRAIENIRHKLANNVQWVNLYPVLAAHKDEPIYLRTDHHWAPLAAFYAAQAFAGVAGVPFKSLDGYEKVMVKNFVGTMYKFSKDASVKNAPEEFVYYTPRDTAYHATFIKYNTGRNHRGGHESSPESGNFFIRYKDGSGSAYCTFMGGDNRTVSVKTNCTNHRRLLIIKDSYGNALPGYLFSSFEEVHIIDFRYFKHSIRKYLTDNGITDLLFANNLLHAHAAGTAKAYNELLTK